LISTDKCIQKNVELFAAISVNGSADPPTRYEQRKSVVRGTQIPSTRSEKAQALVQKKVGVTDGPGKEYSPEVHKGTEKWP
jgi:hypothetical protein